MDPIELIKFFGGLGGLASSSFLIYDRVVRLRPLAFLNPEQYGVCIRLRNFADETVIIDEIKISPPVLSVAMADDLRSTIEAAASSLYPTMGASKKSRTYCIIGPQTERSFRLVRLTEFDALPRASVIKIRCDWRTTRRPWPIRRSVLLRTCAQDLHNLETAAQAAGRA